ncbi:D-inositol-3-phosphate glycosyltransferase [Methylobacterium cerastii]|uniref:D-inositol-3-phosphate glycosyltransferase n=2 Tax=Methylobacterium TaxID=407 RepID=A0ABQ4QEH4_9HYPH|nr:MULTISPECIES: glycosyltransferase [Methylobacterium]TXM70157.1 glycosyltransferase [Methylobacterium sp. WL120]TXN81651.1 glycosyltransferase [Methylobacterium sp. WL8]GJD43517.1 D-inositol-3-phosphate glycosyltransferase [Methylobacterium cerastii]
MRRPRVVFVSHTGTMSGAEMVLCDAVAPWRGATAFLFEDGPLGPALQERGLTLVHARHGAGLSALRRDGSLWRSIPLAGRLLATVLALARCAKSHDVVYANSQKAFVLSALATALVRRPLVWHLHDILDPAHFGAAQRGLQVRLANARATRVVVPSTAAADAFVASGGRRDLVEVVPNGLDLDGDPGDPADLRRSLGLPDGPLVGVFSRLAPWKGQHVVLEALARSPGTACLVAGTALFGEDAYAAGLHALAAERGLADRVHFLGQREDVPRLMRAVDVVVHPSTAPEPFGRTLVEAMLVGTPVIATDAGAAAEILDRGAAGTLVPPGDAAALADAIARVLSAPPEIGDQVARAQATARARYGAARMQARLADLIRRAAGGEGASAAIPEISADAPARTTR